MSGHTPGPWFPVLNCAGAWDITVADTQFSQSVAGVVHNKYIPGDAEANARLIAASPRLLAALKALVAAEDQYCRDTGLKTDDPITRAVKKARAAIAEAEGEA